jgi:hypothetical protein
VIDLAPLWSKKRCASFSNADNTSCSTKGTRCYSDGLTSAPTLKKWIELQLNSILRCPRFNLNLSLVLSVTKEWRAPIIFWLLTSLSKKKVHLTSPMRMKDYLNRHWEPMTLMCTSGSSIILIRQLEVQRGSFRKPSGFLTLRDLKFILEVSDISKKCAPNL